MIFSLYIFSKGKMRVFWHSEPSFSKNVGDSCYDPYDCGNKDDAQKKGEILGPDIYAQSGDPV